jgi:hypothetical protein
VFAASLVAFGCAPRSAPAPEADAEAEAATVSFVDRVWKVSESPGVARGTLYVFLSDGTLVIASRNSQPALGTWRSVGHSLTMVEEGIEYPTDVLSLTRDEFKIASQNPGGTLEITMVPADDPAAPSAE